MKSKRILLLGIETSCDDTAVALIESQGGARPLIKAELVSSQDAIHVPYGGVVPELASREHLKNLPLLLEELLRIGGVSICDLSAIAVTAGPGLKGALLMGLSFAKGVALAANLPLIAVNHIEGHIFSAVLDNPELSFPFLCLVVSGGHSEIIVVSGLGKYEVVSRTIDDAAGEAFDKSAKLLGFSYPGGAALAKLADSGNSSRFKLPRVMREAEGMSFSGLKTAISLLIKQNEERIGEESIRTEIAFAVQEAIVDALCFKVERAVRKTGIHSVALTGGVSANVCLRRSLKSITNVKLYCPGPNHSLDNAAMIAYVGYLRFLNGEKAEVDHAVLSRWPVEQIPMV